MQHCQDVAFLVDLFRSVPVEASRVRASNVHQIARRIGADEAFVTFGCDILAFEAGKCCACTSRDSGNCKSTNGACEKGPKLPSPGNPTDPSADPIRAEQVYAIQKSLYIPRRPSLRPRRKECVTASQRSTPGCSPARLAAQRLCSGCCLARQNSPARELAGCRSCPQVFS